MKIQGPEGITIKFYQIVKKEITPILSKLLQKTEK